MSSGGSSPMRFSGRQDYDYDGGFDPSFTADINNRMRVPKNIRVSGSGSFVILKSSLITYFLQSSPEQQIASL